MSLIFQSLQKTDPENPDHEASAGHEASATSSTAVMKAWMRPVLLSLVLFLVLGVGAVYAVQYLRDRMPAAAETGDLESRPASVSASVRLPVESAPATPSPVPPAGRVSDAVETRFYPPEEQKAQQVTPEAVAPVAMITGKDDDSMAQVQETISDRLPENTISPGNTSSIDRPGHAKADSTTTDFQSATMAAEREQARKARQAQIEKRSHIIRLVRQIEQAVAGGGDPRRTGDLLERLARIKGHDHPYVAKLRAYWHLSLKQYAAAASDLQGVIAANPDDLEAGINLALVEIHNRRYPQALERLKRLRRIHPEDAAVAELIKRLQ